MKNPCLSLMSFLFLGSSAFADVSVEVHSRHRTENLKLNSTQGYLLVAKVVSSEVGSGNQDSNVRVSLRLTSSSDNKYAIEKFKLNPQDDLITLRFTGKDFQAGALLFGKEGRTYGMHSDLVETSTYGGMSKRTATQVHFWPLDE